jgi:hypothetical protein
MTQKQGNESIWKVSYEQCEGIDKGEAVDIHEVEKNFNEHMQCLREDSILLKEFVESRGFTAKKEVCTKSITQSDGFCLKL